MVSHLPLLRHAIYGYTRSDAGNLFQRGQARALRLGSVLTIGSHDRQLFDNILWCLVTSPIFVRCQRLIIDDMSTGSVLCLFAASFGGAVFTATTLVVCAETDDPGGRGDNDKII